MNDAEPSLFDPTGMLRGMRDASMDAWAQMMLQLVRSEEYARATNAILDSYMATSEPLRKLVEAIMLQFIQSDAYAQATRATLDAYLASSAPLRQALEVAMRQALAAMAGGRADLPSFAGWLDPTGVLRGMREASDIWSSAAAQTPFQQSLEATMAQVLTQLNMPTRTDITKLGERLDHLESRLDEIEEKLPPAAPRPAAKPRARKSTAARTKN
jgi:hypothetical protein